MVTVEQLRKEIFALYDRYMKSELNDEYWKSQEGAVSIHYPNYFQQDSPIQVEVYSYLFGSTRHNYFDSIDEAYAAVKKWRRQLEEEIKQGPNYAW